MTKLSLSELKAIAKEFLATNKEVRSVIITEDGTCFMPKAIDHAKNWARTQGLDKPVVLGDKIQGYSGSSVVLLSHAEKLSEGGDSDVVNEKDLGSKDAKAKAAEEAKAKQEAEEAKAKEAEEAKAKQEAETAKAKDLAEAKAAEAAEAKAKEAASAPAKPAAKKPAAKKTTAKAATK
jgi:ATPase subunit of ABC transporter with duplicated ATPase domains